MDQNSELHVSLRALTSMVAVLSQAIPLGRVEINLKFFQFRKIYAERPGCCPVIINYQCLHTSSSHTPVWASEAEAEAEPSFDPENFAPDTH